MPVKCTLRFSNFSSETFEKFLEFQSTRVKKFVGRKLLNWRHLLTGCPLRFVFDKTVEILNSVISQNPMNSTIKTIFPHLLLLPVNVAIQSNNFILISFDVRKRIHHVQQVIAILVFPMRNSILDALNITQLFTSFLRGKNGTKRKPKLACNGRLNFSLT